MEKPQGLLIDLDGTIYRGTARIPGASDFIRHLQAEEVPFLFITNNASRAPEVVRDDLASRHDIHVSSEQIFTSVDALLFVLREQATPPQAAYVLGTDYLASALAKAGITVTRQVARGTETAVVVGIDFDLTYNRLADAGLLLQQGAAFYLTNPDLKLPSERGFLPGNGAIGQLLTTVSEVEPTLCGKPAVPFVEAALARLQIPKEGTVLLGDNLATDILAANNAGLASLLIETGVHTRSDIERVQVVPTAVTENYQTLMEMWWPK